MRMNVVCSSFVLRWNTRMRTLVDAFGYILAFSVCSVKY